VTWQNVEVRIGEYADMAGSAFVIVTAGSSGGVGTLSRRELLPANLPVIKQIAEQINRFCPEAFVITATNPVDPLNYAMYLCSARRDRHKIIGYSLNDTFRFRMLVARALKVNPSRVDGMVIGEHDHSQVLLFSTLRLNGKPITADEALKKRVKDDLAENWILMETYKKRTSGWTSAVGIVAIIRSIINDVCEIIPSNIVLDGEYGYRDLSMTVPAMICKEGTRHIQDLKLAPDEKEGLEVSAQTLRPFMRTVEEYLGLRTVS
jgi:malate/lactate dehydrogenase